MAENTTVTADELRRELPAQDYQTFTLGDDAVADLCLSRAALWVKGKVLQTKGVYDETDAVVRECVLKRAVYELFSFVGCESRAKMKARDIEDLLESYFGPTTTTAGENAGSMSGPAAGCVIKAEVPRYGC